MSTSRPKLTLDEQSFQEMLAAAYTIQEHNAKRRRAQQPQHACERCGAPREAGETLCRQCNGAEFRPGEQMQRKWASLWMMSQEQDSASGVLEEKVSAHKQEQEGEPEQGA